MAKQKSLKIFSETVADRFMYRLSRSLNKRKYSFGFKKMEGFVYDLDSDIIIIDDGNGGTLFKGYMKRTKDDKLYVNFNGRVFYPNSYYALEDFLSYSRANNIFDYSSGEGGETTGGDSGFSDFGGGGSGGGGLDLGGGGGGGMDLGGGGGMDLGGGGEGMDLGGGGGGAETGLEAGGETGTETGTETGGETEELT